MLVGWPAWSVAPGVVGVVVGWFSFRCFGSLRVPLLGGGVWGGSAGWSAGGWSVGSARCWVLRGHLLVVGVVLLAVPGFGRLTLCGLPSVGGVSEWWWLWGRGVVVC